MNWRTILFLAAVLAVAGAAPFMVRAYSVEVLILFMINLILVCSYRIPTMTGDWSLSHVVMMGVGAYATALLSKWWDLSILLTVPLSAVVAAVVGFIIVTPLIRTRGFGFFIASFALGEFGLQRGRRLLGIGVLMVYSSTSVVTPTLAKKNVSEYYYLKKHVFTMLMGLGAMFAVYRVRPELLKKLAIPLLVGSLVLLLLVFVPGVGVSAGGAED